MPNNAKNNDELKEMAAGMGVRLFARYSEKEAAPILGVSAATLQRIRFSGHIAFLQVSERRIYYFGRHLLEYLLEQERGATCHDIKKETAPSNSAITGSPDAQAARDGSERGSMPPLDKQDALASARRILNKPKSG